MPELFANFEVNREPRWKLVLTLCCSSVVLHLVVLATVIYVPPLREALNIAAMFGKSSYVDKAYAKTTFGENIQILQLTPRFQYPPGYFAIGTPAFMAAATATPNPLDPKIISVAGPVQPATAAASASPPPTASPAVAQTKVSPSASPSPASGTPGGSEAADGKPGKTTEDQKKAEAQKQLDDLAAANNVDLPAENEINKQPLKDLAVAANKLKDTGQLDLNKSFEIVIEGSLDANGKLIGDVTRKTGDGSLAGLAKQAIEAINQSGLLGYLKTLNDGQPTKVIVVVGQDQDFLTARFESEVGSEDSARKKAKGFNAMLLFAQQVREGKDEEVLMSHTTVSADGRKLIINFKMPAQDAGAMIKKQMAANTATKS